jgi:hypothetical protein
MVLVASASLYPFGQQVIEPFPAISSLVEIVDESD